LNVGYPSTFGTIQEWCRTNGIGVQQGHRRFAQYAVLSAIAEVPSLRRDLVFKGGNALDFMWLLNRSTLDLDFSLDAETSTGHVDLDSLQSQLQQGLRVVSGPLGIALKLQRARANPRGSDKTFVTYQFNIGYALSDETPLRVRMASGEPSSRVIAVEISLNEPQCANTMFVLDESRQLRIGTLEDIVAEKLCALLQQSIRGRDRRQDLLDIAVAILQGQNLDRRHVADYLVEKSAARSVNVSRAAFYDPEVARHARKGYAELQTTTRTCLVAFEEALATVLTFVDELPIPER